ncbi:hypothetical protein GCM10022408_35760 [Hymenobacter fastidiosus]|uniref:DUF3035 domain-containing protein n=1 Tax=Hymenobacter fastidiosus TaxID=486264 RepID=A0ABP7SZC6_9BACT
MTKNFLLSGLALATLTLNACSSEPSDYRADKKVSIDMVPPGTRSSENYDHGTASEPHQAKGGAIAQPISTNTAVDESDVNVRNKPAAEQTISANAEEVERTKKGSDATKIKAEINKMPADTTGNQREKN